MFSDKQHRNSTYHLSSNQNSPEKKIIILIQFKLNSENDTINVEYEYDVRNLKLHRMIWKLKNSASANNNKHDIEVYLQKQNTSIKEIEKRADDILKNHILKDWVSVYSSRFSPTNWGDVKVVEKWEE